MDIVFGGQVADLVVAEAALWPLKAYRCHRGGVSIASAAVW
jgi:hypothetical protein